MDKQLSDRNAIISSYAGGPDLLDTAIAGLNTADLDIAESDGRWTIRQIVHHVVDGDDIWKSFIKQAIGNPGSRFELQWYWELPQDEWVERWGYKSRAIEPSLALFRANREHIVQLLQEIPAAWEQTLLILWPKGDEQEVSVAWVVEMQAQHVLGHVEDIRRALKAHRI